MHIMAPIQDDDWFDCANHNNCELLKTNKLIITKSTTNNKHITHNIKSLPIPKFNVLRLPE